MNNRAQSIGIARMILTLAVGAVVIFLVSTVGESVLPGAKNATTNSTANQGTTYMMQVSELLPVTIALLSFFGLIVLAIYLSETR